MKWEKMGEDVPAFQQQIKEVSSLFKRKKEWHSVKSTLTLLQRAQEELEGSPIPLQQRLHKHLMLLQSLFLFKKRKEHLPPSSLHLAYMKLLERTVVLLREELILFQREYPDRYQRLIQSERGNTAIQAIPYLNLSL